MSVFWRMTLPSAAAAALLLFGGGEVEATNGMNMIGYGAVSPAMGGADLAMVDNATAMNINPAGLCACAAPEFGFGFRLLASRLQHRDSLGNGAHDGEDQLFPLPLLTYAAPIDGTRLTFGFGLFSQGGMGAEFNDLHTPFAAAGLGAYPGQSVPERDDIFSDLRYIKAAPTLAWRSPQGKLKLGASLQFGYVQAAMKYFPHTSVYLPGIGDEAQAGGMTFAGMDLDGLAAFGYGARCGFQYHLGEVTIGGAYLSETELDFRDGSMRLNLSAFELGKVKYDARMTGMNWPRQAGVGISWPAFPWLRLAADLDWIDWSSAMKTVKIRLKEPNHPAAPPTQEIVIPMNWKDQWVYALGLEVRPASDWVLRLGYNHGNSPVPDDTLSPLFPAIVEDHLTAGIGLALGKWQVDLGVEWGLPARQKNRNPDPQVNPFGAGTQERHSQITTHLMLRRYFWPAPAPLPSPLPGNPVEEPSALLPDPGPEGAILTVAIARSEEEGATIDPVAAGATAPAVVAATPALPIPRGGGAVARLEEQIEQVLQQWAGSWSSQHLAAYLACYSERFRPAGNLTPSAWREQRRQRLAQPEWIEVTLKELRFLPWQGEAARVEVVQEYRSSHYHDQVRKRLDLVQENGRWRIVAEYVP
ncbi:MAG: outer membrane protein transport protein [Desulfuromonadales bacterium]|nr:outer membrane protein transport protein [Desulfuromonadales bacterium]